MTASTKDRAKKLRERFFLERFVESAPRRLQIVDQREAPDFVLRDDAGEFGVEVAEVFKDRKLSNARGKLESSGRSLEARRVRYLRDLAAEYYRRGGRPLRVQALLPEQFDFPLLDLVVARLLAERPSEPMERVRIEVEPRATFYLLALPDNVPSYSWWVAVDNSVGWRRQARLEDMQTLVDEKAKRLAHYRRVSPRVELLMFADGTRSSGMISWQGDFAPLDARGFDAVWLYVHPGRAWLMSEPTMPVANDTEENGR